LQIALIKSFSSKAWRNADTFQRIEDSLKEKWTVSSIATQDPQELHEFLSHMKENSSDGVFVFNISEYLDEDKKEGFIPALLDQWGFPHLGSKAEVIANGLDKEKTKRLLIENHIPTPRFFIATTMDCDYSDQAEGIGYPLFVKPLNEGGHIGISDNSIVRNSDDLHKEIAKILTIQKEPVLVEEFITGDNMREFSVGIINGEITSFTPIEIDFVSMGQKTDILSFESAEQDLERIMLVREQAVREKLYALTERTFSAMGASDYSRVDIRMGQNGYYVLEINVMPGLGPHSFLPEAAETIHKINYHQLIQTLAENSIIRQQSETLVA